MHTIDLGWVLIKHKIFYEAVNCLRRAIRVCNWLDKSTEIVNLIKLLK